eukprot:scaffold131645_cov36-Phaeocystis_antarctica.AAC.1
MYQAGVDADALQPARAVLADAPAAVDWTHTALRLVGVTFNPSPNPHPHPNPNTKSALTLSQP